MPHFDWNHEELNEVLRLAHEESRRWLDALPERHVGPRVTLEGMRERFDRGLTDDGVDAATTIRELIDASREGLIASPGPRFFGFVIGGSFPVAVAADWLTTAWDQNAGLYAATPAASTCEEVAAKWLLELLGLPEDAGVGFVTGCQMANTTALAAARHAVLRDAGWNVEELGLQGAPKIHVVTSSHSHATIFTALRLVGLGQANAIRVDADDQGRMLPAALAAALEPLEGPVIVCTQAGNVNSGAFDPFEEIIPLAREKNAWVHVDGAFGLWALASPRHAALAAGAAGADSWATDAHKWLNVPYDSGIVIVRDRAAHLGATSVKADYLIQAEETRGAARDPLDWTPEFSRRGRGFPVYATLRYLGRNGVAELVDRGCRNASLAAELLGAEPGLSILNEVVLNQVLFGCEAPSDLDHAQFVDMLIRQIQDDGTCWLSGTRWEGRAAIRLSVSNWSTGTEDIERSATAIRDIYRSLASQKI